MSDKTGKFFSLWQNLLEERVLLTDFSKSCSMVKWVLNVKIDDISESEALKKVGEWFHNKSGGKIIATVGPEFLVTAQKEEDFKKILNTADLALPEGFGLNLYAGVRNRIPGREFMVKLCGLAAENDWSIGLVGGWVGDGKKVAKKLKTLFPGIKILLVIDGDEATKIKMGYDMENYIKEPIDILFLGFGHPVQEKILVKSKKLFRVGVGVGGSLDYLAGKYPEPPKFLVVIGQEWVWRLVTQPWRIGRILRATIVFPLVLLLNRGPFRTRQ